MLNIAAVVFAIAALGGIVLAAHVLRGRFAPWALSLLHAALGAAGLVLVLVAVLGGARGNAALSFALLWLGVLLGVPTMIFGFVDFLRLPPQLQRSGALNWHIFAMLGAWATFLGAALLRPMPAPPFPPATLAATLLEIAGFACLGAGGVLAAAVVFDGWPRPAEEG